MAPFSPTEQPILRILAPYSHLLLCRFVLTTVTFAEITAILQDD